MGALADWIGLFWFPVYGKNRKHLDSVTVWGYVCW
jgi:hypothetical protein